MEYRSWISDSRRWDGFEFRAGDIVISTPPKSGTTWTQMLCALLIFDGPRFPAPMDQLSPWLDQSNRPLDQVLAALSAQKHRRFIKTHTPLDGVPWHDGVIYLVVGRDPRDVAVSFHHHRERINYARFLEQRAGAVGKNDDIGPPQEVRQLTSPTESFQYFLDATDAIVPVPSLRNVLHHLETGWQRQDAATVGLFHFSDYHADTAAELSRLAQLLEIPLTSARAAELAGMTGIEQMRSDASQLAPNATDGFWRDPAAFFRTGGDGEWRAIATPSQLAQYEELTATLVSPDLARWAERGSLAARSA